MRLCVATRLFVISSVIGGTVLSLMPTPLSAQIRKFPYQAVIERDGLSVRSGPGMRKYYATGPLKRGARVMVHRHDPGGWYMIAPPEGSFSWIRAEYVDADGRGSGLLNSNNIVVRVGSVLSDNRNVVQRRLSTGDRVRILSEQTVPTEAGPIRMYKIKPPQGEYRWIQGQYVTPVSEQARREQTRDPFARPPQARVPAAQLTRTLLPGKYDSQPQRFSRSLTGGKKSPGGTPRSGRSAVRRKPSRDAVRRSGPTDEQIAADRQRLRQLDNRFRAIIRQKTSRWNFVQLERDYHAFQKSTAISALASQVDLRFDALKRYKTVKAEYDSFIQLTSQTSRREAELLSRQHRQQTAVGEAKPIPRSPSPAPPPSRPTLETPVPVPSIPPQYRPETRPETRPPAGPVLRSPPPPQSVPFPQSSTPLPSQPSFPSPSSLPTQPPVITRYPQQAIPISPTGPTTPTGPTARIGGQPIRSAPSRTVVRGRVPASAGPPPKFDAAGIVRRVQPKFQGAPQYGLVSPSGQLLAYVRGGDGINLERYLGRPVGVSGQRFHRTDVPLELIVVRNLAPVQLAPSR